MTRGGEFDILIKLSRGEQERARLGTAANLENDTEKRERRAFIRACEEPKRGARGVSENSQILREKRLEGEGSRRALASLSVEGA